jgi:AcrR family transcriptional regulator
MSEGLRERKKAKTRWAIQEHAMRLFGEQGYAATTVDQIAAAAEISPSTFFRYFATKEDVVVQDQYDDLFVTAFRAAGGTKDPIATLRRMVSDALKDMPADDPGGTALVGAFTGVLLSVAVSVAESGTLADLLPRLDAALALLEGVDWFGAGGP